MEEGTGLSLYILVGSILFGLFAVMATAFGTDIQAQTGNFVACVQSYVLDDPTDCGGSDSNETTTPTTIVHNIEANYEGFEGVYEAFLDNVRLQVLGVTDDRHGFNEAIYAAGIEAGSTDNMYVEYAVFDENGNIRERFIYGDIKTANHVVINDERLLPKGNEYSVIGGGYALGTGSVRHLKHQSGINNGKIYIIGTDEGVETADRVHANK